MCCCVCSHLPRIRPKVWYPTSLLSLPSGIKVLSLGAVRAISAIDEDIPEDRERERGKEGKRGKERDRVKKNG